MDGRILDANQALAQMLAFDSVDEILSHNINDVYRDPAERQRLIERYAREGASMGPVEVEWRRKDGVAVAVRLTARIVDFGEDGGRCFEGVVEDATTRRALEEQLRRAQKMEAVGRLARGIAHDFNNVLAAIIGWSDVLIAQLTPGDAVYSDAMEIRDAAGRGAALTRQLLAFSRHQPADTGGVDLNAVVAHVETLLRRLAGDRAAVRIATLGEAPIVRVEAGQLEQVLLNLVVNARDAMPDGGTIDIRIDRISLDAQAALRYPPLAPGYYARIAVTDGGTGIDPAVQEHVFEPFFTTKDATDGTGLGLSIVYGIAQEKGGTVVFTTDPGRGTTFEVLLPVASS